jgi:hypothetical protein
MKHLFSLLVIGLLFSMTSCLEIIDDLSLNGDGSGMFKYTVNMSSSKVKINSYLALDSLDGKKVPSISEITNHIDELIDELCTQEGISNVTFDSDYNNFVFKLKLDFASIDELEEAIKAIVRKRSKGRVDQELDHEWLTYSESSLNRSIPRMNFERTKNLKADEIADLKKGMYTSITRFESEVASFDNESAIVAKNKKAVMVRANPYSLIRQTNLLDNTIYLEESAENE